MEMSEVPHVLPTSESPTWTTRNADLATEAAVLGRVLAVQPARITVDELIRELAGEQAEFTDQDGIRRAVRDLSGVGLLHMQKDPRQQRYYVSPTRAALRNQELLER